LIVEEDHSAPVVGVVTIVGTGSTRDPPGKEGLAYLVQRLTFHATPSRGRDFAGLLEQAGAAFTEATTDFDTTSYYEFGARDTLGDLLTLEGHRITGPLAGVDERIFDIEREVVRNELRFREVSAGTLWPPTYKTTSLVAPIRQRPVAGSYEDLASLAPDDPRATGWPGGVRHLVRPGLAITLSRGGLEYHGTPTGLTGDLWASLLRATYPPSHPYARPPVGSPESLSRLTLADALAFVKEHYVPENMTLYLIGDMKLESVGKLLDDSLSQRLNQPTPNQVLITGGPSRVVPEPPDPPTSAGVVTIDGPSATPELYVVWSLPRSYEEGSYLAKLAVGDLQVAVDTAAARDLDVRGGSAFVLPGKLASTLVCRVLLRDAKDPAGSAGRVLDDLVYNWVQAAGGSARAAQWDLDVRRARLSTLTLLEGESIVHRGLELAEYVRFTRDPPPFYLDKISLVRAVEADDVGRLYYRYVNRDRARTVLVRPLEAEPRASAPGPRFPDTGAARASIGYEGSSIAKIALPAGLAAGFRREKLPSGLVIEAARRGTTPLVTIGLGFRGGPADEQNDGAATLGVMAAHVWRAWHGHFEHHGAVMTRKVTADGLEFRVYVPIMRLRRVLRILADHVSSLRVSSASAEYFDWFKLSDVRRSQSLPESLADRSFRRALFQAHPYAKTSAIPCDKRTARDAANRWLDTVLTPTRGVLAIAGNIDQEEALQLARDEFGDFARGEARADPPPLPEAGARAVIVTHREGAQWADVQIGCRLPPAGLTGTIENQILADIVNRRIQKIGNRAESSGFVASTSTLAGGSAVLSLEGVVDGADLATALRAIRGELGGEPITDAEVDRARWVVARRYNLQLATPDDWVTGALDAGRLGWDLGAIDALPGLLSSIDKARLNASLRRCAAEGVVSVVGDQSSIRPQLAAAWP
jgi:zinc protease